MAQDALRTAHPIQQDIAEESKMTAPSTINYERCGHHPHDRGLSRESKFHDGMRLYMKTHAYSNATTADLWAALRLVTKAGPVACEELHGISGVPPLHVTTSQPMAGHRHADARSFQHP